MNWRNRVKMSFGILIVLILLAILTIKLTNSLDNINSQSAKLQSDSYSIGSNYSGLMLKQYVQVGQYVTLGQPLFDIKSDLTNLTNNNFTIGSSNIAYSISPSGDIILKATGNGTISQVNYIEGSFVPAGQIVANITKANSLYVQAEYILSPPDYARLKIGDVTLVTLPSDVVIKTYVYNTSIVNNNNQVVTIVKSDSINLKNNPIFVSGTPVSAQLQLSGKTLYNIFIEKLTQLINPK